MRRIAILIVLVACKRAASTETPPEPPGPPSTGHSVTHLKDDPKDPKDPADPKDPKTTDETAHGSAVAVEDAPAPAIGGNDMVARRDAEGHVHGPGGPVFMGEGPPCDASRNHCIRGGTFGVENVVAGKLFRALPVFQFEDKWWNWRGDEQNSARVLRTVVATDKIASGETVIWFTADSGGKKWADSEYDALTSSRWEVGIVASVNSPAKTFRVTGWDDEIPLDTARVVVETK